MFIQEYENIKGLNKCLKSDFKPSGPVRWPFWGRVIAAWAVLTGKAHAIEVGDNWQPDVCFGITWPEPSSYVTPEEYKQLEEEN